MSNNNKSTQSIESIKSMESIESTPSITRQQALDFVKQRETVTEQKCKDYFVGSSWYIAIRTMRSEDVEELINLIYGKETNQ